MVTSLEFQNSVIGVVIGKSLKFTARVADISSGFKGVATGLVNWSDGGAGGTFGNIFVGGICILAAVTTYSSSCSITYKPASSALPGAIIDITANYGGDIPLHMGSSGSSILTVLGASATSISPANFAVLANTPVIYKVNVTDTTLTGTPSAPTGTVFWTSSVSGGSFSS